MKRRCLTVAILLLATPIAASAAQEGTSAQGAQLYAKHCAMCHGDRGEGAKLGPNLTHETDADAVKTVVRDGKKKMPGFGEKLSSSEIEAVSQFVTDQLSGGGS